MRRFAIASFLSLLSVSPVLANVDNWRNEGWTTNFEKITVDPPEIQTILQRDRIPSIDEPKFIPVRDESDLPDREPVVSLVINGDARAYPLRIMMWHEIVNDVVGDMPVAVTYCPLCNSSIVFDANVGGAPAHFGTTGKLRNSDLVMYDRTSQTWWQQFSGEGLVGDHAGEKLTMIPSRLDSWARFKQEHPDGQVLVPNNERSRAYWMNPYDKYDTAKTPFLFSGTLPTGMPAMERVVIVKGDEPVAVAVSLLEKEGRVVDDGIVMTWEPGQASALDTSRISEGRDVGNVNVFRIVDGVEQPIVHDVTFAFVVNAFEPTLTIRTE